MTELSASLMRFSELETDLNSCRHYKTRPDSGSHRTALAPSCLADTLEGDFPLRCTPNGRALPALELRLPLPSPTTPSLEVLASGHFRPGLRTVSTSTAVALVSSSPTPPKQGTVWATSARRRPPTSSASPAPYSPQLWVIASHQLSPAQSTSASSSMTVRQQPGRTGRHSCYSSRKQPFAALYGQPGCHGPCSGGRQSPEALGHIGGRAEAWKLPANSPAPDGRWRGLRRRSTCATDAETTCRCYALSWNPRRASPVIQ